MIGCVLTKPWGIFFRKSDNNNNNKKKNVWLGWEDTADSIASRDKAFTIQFF